MHTADRLRQCRAQHGRKLHSHQRVAGQPCPSAVTIANGDIGRFLAEIDDPVTCCQPHRDVWMGDLEGADIARQPLPSEGRRGVNEQRVIRVATGCRNRLLQHLEGFRHLRRQPLAHFRQRDLPRPPQEQRFADVLLDHLDLVADRRLGHAQFRAGPGEAAEPGGGLEDPQRIQRELLRHLHG